MVAEASPNVLLVLNPNVHLAPAADYPEDTRARLGGAGDDVVVSERRSRYSALRVSAETAQFIRRFTSPSRLLDAVVAHSRDVGDDPMELLESLFPLVCQFREQRILVHPEEARPAATEPRFAPGADVGGCRIIRCVVAQTETEIYKVQTPDGGVAALKWVPVEAPAFVAEAIAREERMLARLERSRVASVPRVLGAGTIAGEGRYLLLSWCEGHNVHNLVAAGRLDLATRSALAARLVAIYTRLHRHGVLHGDVHPGNVIGDERADPMVLDFGSARLVGDDDRHPRAGVLTDYEPEAARELLGDRPAPPASPLGEQYCVAAIVFRLITGTTCLRLSLEGMTALRQIVEQEPRAFADAGLAWPAVEAVLRRALAKDPARRFPDMAAFHTALAVAIASGVPDDGGVTAARTVDEGNRTHAPGRLLAMYGPDGGLLDAGLTAGPTASLYYGAAGIAYGLLRAAILNASAHALDAADAWIEQAIASAATPAAFDGRDIGIQPEDIGPAALFHTVTGVHVVRALVRHATGDVDGASASVHAFLAGIPDAPADGRARFAVDVMNGPASHLLAATWLFSVCTHRAPRWRGDLETAIDRLSAIVLANVAAYMEPGAEPDAGDRYLGVAHGLAGALFALCRAAEMRRRPLPAAAGDALDRLAAMAIEDGDALAWPVYARSTPSAPWTGWCHGAAGYGLLWSTAARVRGRTDDIERALGAARYVWAHREHANPSLCCGLAGEALSLSEVARASGDATWHARARLLLERAVALPFDPVAPHSLFRGRFGIALAGIELEHAEHASFPLLSGSAQ